MRIKNSSNYYKNKKNHLIVYYAYVCVEVQACKKKNKILKIINIITHIF